MPWSPNGRGWRPGYARSGRLLYRLPELVRRRFTTTGKATVYVTEGGEGMRRRSGPLATSRQPIRQAAQAAGTPTTARGDAEQLQAAGVYKGRPLGVDRDDAGRQVRAATPSPRSALRRYRRRPCRSHSHQREGRRRSRTPCGRPPPPRSRARRSLGCSASAHRTPAPAGPIDADDADDALRRHRERQAGSSSNTNPRCGYVPGGGGLVAVLGRRPMDVSRSRIDAPCTHASGVPRLRHRRGGMVGAEDIPVDRGRAAGYRRRRIPVH